MIVVIPQETIRVRSLGLNWNSGGDTANRSKRHHQQRLLVLFSPLRQIWRSALRNTPIVDVDECCCLSNCVRWSLQAVGSVLAVSTLAYLAISIVTKEAKNPS
jgi:hypothetical protein